MNRRDRLVDWKRNTKVRCVVTTLVMNKPDKLLDSDGKGTLLLLDLVKAEGKLLKKRHLMGSTNAWLKSLYTYALSGWMSLQAVFGLLGLPWAFQHTPCADATCSVHSCLWSNQRLWREMIQGIEGSGKGREMVCGTGFIPKRTSLVPKIQTNGSDSTSMFGRTVVRRTDGPCFSYSPFRNWCWPPTWSSRTMGCDLLHGFFWNGFSRLVVADTVARPWNRRRHSHILQRGLHNLSSFRPRGHRSFTESQSMSRSKYNEINLSPSRHDELIGGHEHFFSVFSAKCHERGWRRSIFNTLHCTDFTSFQNRHIVYNSNASLRILSFNKDLSVCQSRALLTCPPSNMTSSGQRKGDEFNCWLQLCKPGGTHQSCPLVVHSVPQLGVFLRYKFKWVVTCHVHAYMGLSND